MTIYVVNNTYTFTHYGEAMTFARRINGKIKIVKTINPIKYLLAAI